MNYNSYCYGDPKPLVEFPMEDDFKVSRRVAIAYAKQHPEATGYVTVAIPNGGWRFYEINGGKAFVRSAVDCLPKFYAVQERQRQEFISRSARTRSARKVA